MVFRQQGRALVIHTPAKLNLFLEVLDKRTDGFHELETLMVAVGLYDTLVITEDSSPATRLRVFQAGPRPTGSGARMAEVPVGPENLVVRAAELLRNHARVSRGVRIDLYKRIPVAAGLGGGSSDAAAALSGLNRRFDLRLSTEQLQEFAAELGSDVGFFLGPSGAAVCRGRGEIIEPTTLPLDLHFVIARPRSGLSTAAVYQRCRPADCPRNSRDVLQSLQRGHLDRAGQGLYNALQPAAELLNPELSHLKTLLSGQPVLGHVMSGSGTAWFGLCAHRRQARQIAARLRASSQAFVTTARSRP